MRNDLVRTTLAEAAARRLRADLVMRAVRPGADTRLISRFLGLSSDRGVILEVPRTVRGDLVYVPDGWQVGVSWQLDRHAVQAVMDVIGHPQFPVQPTHKVDSLLLRWPDRVILLDRRREIRWELDPSHPVRIEVWQDLADDAGLQQRPYGGRLVDRSESGMGLRLPAALPWAEGSRLIVRLQGDLPHEAGLYRATLAYCAPDEDYGWRVGLARVEAVEPGECPSLIAALLKDSVRTWLSADLPLPPAQTAISASHTTRDEILKRQKSPKSQPRRRDPS